MVGVISTSTCHIVEHSGAVQTVSVSHCYQSLRSEGTFRVDIETLAFTPSHVSGKLTRDCQRVTQLSLTCVIKRTC